MISALRCLLVTGMAGCAALACTHSVRPADDIRIASAKAAFRSPTSVSLDAAAAGQDAIWRLGQTLFYDPVLSRSGRTSCATCHQPGHGWSDANRRAVGDGGASLAFKTPTLLGAGSLDRLGWTGRFADVAAVTAFAITSPTNMGLSIPDAAERLRREPSYVAAFGAAFGDRAIKRDEILQALGAYVTSLHMDTPFDRWIDGDASAIDEDARRGFAVFTGKGRCAQCHSGPTLTDGSFHDIGSNADDLGRGGLFKTSVKLQHAFKTPSLRGVAKRGPYMHDGSRATLEDVVELYDRGGIDRPSRADVIRPLGLTAAEKADLVAFLKSLSGETRYVVAK